MAPRSLTVLSLLLCAAAAGAAPAAKTTAADYAAVPDVPAKLTAPPPHPPKVRLSDRRGRCTLSSKRAAARSDTRWGSRRARKPSLGFAGFAAASRLGALRHRSGVRVLGPRARRLGAAALRGFVRFGARVWRLQCSLVFVSLFLAAFLTRRGPASLRRPRRPSPWPALRRRLPPRRLPRCAAASSARFAMPYALVALTPAPPQPSPPPPAPPVPYGDIGYGRNIATWLRVAPILNYTCEPVLLITPACAHLRAAGASCLRRLA